MKRMKEEQRQLNDQMFKQAKQAMSKAYAPYSRFKVGAVVRAENGKLYSGCNVENAAYPLGNCAEASAVSSMIMDGQTSIIEVCVIGPGAALVTPCGGCRQRLREFAGDDVEIHICGPEGHRKTVTLGELLPLSFGPENLTVSENRNG